MFSGELVFRPSPQNLCLRNRILLQQHAANNQIRRNLCDLLRRQNSVAETKIFTKIFQYTRSHVSLVCVARVSVWFWRKERRKNRIFDFGRAEMERQPIFARSSTLVPKPHGNACYPGYVATQRVAVTSPPATSRM